MRSYSPGLLALPLLLAATPAGFAPGLWRFTNIPTGATLDGRPLGDLPYTGSAGPNSVCLTALQTRDAAFLTAGLPPDCKATRRSLAKGRVDITLVCPPQAEKLARGTARVTGRWTPNSYDVTFKTANPSENGVMGFTGRMTGKRVADCTPATPPPLH